MFEGFWADAKAGLTRPFNLPFVTLGASIGVLIVIVIFWVFILERLEGE